jgi:hypothetical protein
MSNRTNSLLARRFRIAVVIGSTLLGGAITAGCAAPEEGEESAETDEALSVRECNAIVQRSVAQSRTECNAKRSRADQARATRGRLEQNVVRAVAAFGTELTNYGGANRAEIDETLNECNAIRCAGQLRRGEVTAECNVETAFLKAACFIRNLPELRAAGASLDFSQEATALDAAVDAMAAQWPSLALQEASLRVQHATCSTYVGSSVQTTKLYGTCRASCNERNPTAISGVMTGWGAYCTPPGFEDVKDDLGQEVDCGTFQRPILSAGAICECRPSDACTQFSSLGASSQRGQDCRSGERKLVWDGKNHVARLECR